MFYTNADQFLDKRDDFLLHINNNEPEIIMITEVLPKVELNFISEVQLHIPGFTLFIDFPLDCDLSDKTVGRGIAIYLSQKLKAVSQVHFINSSFQEQLWIKVLSKAMICCWWIAFIEVHLLMRYPVLSPCVTCLVQYVITLTFLFVGTSIAQI